MADPRKRERTRASTPSSSARHDAQIEYASGVGLLLRLFWMAVGNLLLLYLAGSIAREPVWSVSGRDVAYWLTVAALIVARYIDVARYGGLTINSEPATRDHVGRYAVGLIVLASIAWAGAQAVKL